jgi:hypothetical protein
MLTKPVIIIFSFVLVFGCLFCSKSSNPANPAPPNNAVSTVDVNLIGTWIYYERSSHTLFSDSAGIARYGIRIKADSLINNAILDTMATDKANNIVFHAQNGQMWLDWPDFNQKIYAYDYSLHGDSLFILEEMTGKATNPTADSAYAQVYIRKI